MNSVGNSGRRKEMKCLKNDGLYAEHPNREKILVVMLTNLRSRIDIDKGII
jgi:hypothetical protein